MTDQALPVITLVADALCMQRPRNPSTFVFALLARNLGVPEHIVGKMQPFLNVAQPSPQLGQVKSSVLPLHVSVDDPSSPLSPVPSPQVSVPCELLGEIRATCT